MFANLLILLAGGPGFEPACPLSKSLIFLRKLAVHSPNVQKTHEERRREKRPVGVMRVAALTRIPGALKRAVDAVVRKA